jgi:hypothetical protein
MSLKSSAAAALDRADVFQNRKTIIGLSLVGVGLVGERLVEAIGQAHFAPVFEAASEMGAVLAGYGKFQQVRRDKRKKAKPVDLALLEATPDDVLDRYIRQRKRRPKP